MMGGCCMRGDFGFGSSIVTFRLIWLFIQAPLEFSSAAWFFCWPIFLSKLMVQKQFCWKQMETRFSMFPMECFLGPTFQSMRIQCLDRTCSWWVRGVDQKTWSDRLQNMCHGQRSWSAVLLVSFLARAIRMVVHLSSLKIKPTSTKKSVLVVTTIHIVEPLSKESPRVR
jgi:hypothetical protein